MTIEMEVEKPVVRFVNVTMPHLDCGKNPHLTFKSDLELVEGDLVVCDTRCGIHIGTVVGFIPIEKEFTLPIDHKWKYIIQKVDLTDHEIRKAKEARLIEIKQEMMARQAIADAKQAKHDALIPFIQTAEEDTVMAALLVELWKLDDEF